MKAKLIIILLILFLAKMIYAKDKEVIYPNRDGIGEHAFGYQLLKLILPKTGKNYMVKIVEESSNQDRALAELETGKYSVVDTGIGIDFEKRFDAVYIPIDMGLTGWRIFIINKKQQKDFAKIKTLEQLRKKKAGQGIGWTDADILRNAGIKVESSARIENLIKMVNAERFDFLPLGVNEAHGFLFEYKKKGDELMVEETIVLKYPFARLFYVKKGNSELKQDIKLGLEKAFKDGSFKKLVESNLFFKEGLSKSNLKNRIVIEIENPYMTEKFKHIDSKWWYRIE